MTGEIGVASDGLSHLMDGLSGRQSHRVTFVTFALGSCRRKLVQPEVGAKVHGALDSAPHLIWIG